MNHSYLTFTGVDNATTVQQLLGQITSGEAHLTTAAGYNVTDALCAYEVATSVIYAPLSQTPAPTPADKSPLMSVALIGGLAAVAVVALGASGALFARFVNRAAPGPVPGIKGKEPSALQGENSFLNDFVPEDDPAPQTRKRKPRQRGSVFQRGAGKGDAGKRESVFLHDNPMAAMHAPPRASSGAPQGGGGGQVRDMRGSPVAAQRPMSVLPAPNGGPRSPHDLQGAVFFENPLS
jgi:hypothetical protein